jgi:hypothetical protein
MDDQDKTLFSNDKWANDTKNQYNKIYMACKYEDGYQKLIQYFGHSLTIQFTGTQIAGTLVLRKHHFYPLSNGLD